jgi:hypothetical protein
MDTVHIGERHFSRAELDDLCQVMRRCGGPRHLILMDCSFPKDAVLPLKGLVRVEYLSLGGSDFSDDALKELSELPRLQKLYLFGTPVTDRVVDYLIACESLESVSLKGTNVTAEGILKLREQRPGVAIER